jgi:hypothetical protein
LIQLVTYILEITVRGENYQQKSKNFESYPELVGVSFVYMSSNQQNDAFYHMKPSEIGSIAIHTIVGRQTPIKNSDTCLIGRTKPIQQQDHEYCQNYIAGY